VPRQTTADKLFTLKHRVAQEAFSLGAYGYVVKETTSAEDSWVRTNYLGFRRELANLPLGFEPIQFWKADV
jgi:hypothetical protein